MLVKLDLETTQPTYMFLTPLLAAERERLARGDPHLSLEILPGSAGGGFGRYKHWPRSQMAKRGPIDFRPLRRGLKHVVYPMIEMLPSVIGYKLLENREDATDDPDAFELVGTFSMKPFVDAYEAGIRPFRAPLPLPRNPRLITMTLREMSDTLWRARDSNLKDWVAAAKQLIARGYEVVIVRDTRLARVGIKDINTAPEASLDLFTRANLYRSAALNLFVSNGPAWFAFALDVPMIMFRPTSERANANSTAESMAAFGIVKGEQLPNAQPHQWLSWTHDEWDTIVTTVERFFEDAQVQSVHRRADPSASREWSIPV